MLPAWKRWASYERILILGVGGGHDVYGGLFLYEELKRQHKTVYLANYSFSDGLADHYPAAGTPWITKITADSKAQEYFPELHLARQLQTEVYALRNLAPPHVTEGLRHLIAELQIDHVIAVDAGWDALLYGDEDAYRRASPYEDMCTVTSLLELMDRGLMPSVTLMCVSAPSEGLEFDKFLHHTQDLTAHDGFLGAMSIHFESSNFRELLDRLPATLRSIPNECILAASEGRGDLAAYVNPRLTERFRSEDLAIADSEWYPAVSVLNGMAWCFDLEVLRKRSPLAQYLMKNQSKVVPTEANTASESIRFNELLREWFNLAQAMGPT